MRRKFFASGPIFRIWCKSFFEKPCRPKISDKLSPGATTTFSHPAAAPRSFEALVLSGRGSNGIRLLENAFETGGVAVLNFRFDAQPVPEPGVIAGLVAGLSLLVVLHRRYR